MVERGICSFVDHSNENSLTTVITRGPLFFDKLPVMQPDMEFTKDEVQTVDVWVKFPRSHFPSVYH